MIKYPLEDYVRYVITLIHCLLAFFLFVFVFFLWHFFANWFCLCLFLYILGQSTILMLVSNDHGNKKISLLKTYISILISGGNTLGNVLILKWMRFTLSNVLSWKNKTKIERSLRKKQHQKHSINTQSNLKMVRDKAIKEIPERNKPTQRKHQSHLTPLKMGKFIINRKGLEREKQPLEMKFLIPYKLNWVKEVLTVRAWEREAAPKSPILFQSRFNWVNLVLTERAWEREAAPESPKLFQPRPNWVNIVWLTERA